MRFICLKENLEKALTIAERFTGKNITLPILGNILLETTETALFVTATNLEYAIRVKIAGKTEKPGRVSVPAKIISSLLQSTRSEKVDLEEKQGSLFIKTDTRDIRINGINAEDFPLIPKIKKTYSLAVDSLSLAASLTKVLPAVSSSEFKPELNGVFLKAVNSSLNLAATDTFRLAESRLTLLETQNNEISLILPQKIAQEIARIPAKGELVISWGDNQVLFETDDIKIISRTIEGNFPEYSGIIPKKFEAASFVGREKLVEAIRSSSIFASKLQEVRLNLTRQTLEITASNPEIGEYKTRLDVKSSGKNFPGSVEVAGQDTAVNLGFNFRYLLDGLTSLDDEEIFLGLNSENAPTMIRNREDDLFKYVLMPIRVS